MSSPLGPGLHLGNPSRSCHPREAPVNITCDQSDYLEIACLYRIPIALDWADGKRVEGVPLDTGYNEQRQECLQMELGDGPQWVVLEGALSMTALEENKHFAQVRFG